MFPFALRRRRACPVVAGILILILSAPGFAVVSTDRNALLPVLSEAEDAGEYWDVTAVLDSGHRFLTRFLITNLGPGSRTAVGIGYLVYPDGHSREFKRAKRSGDWKLSPDRRRLKVGAAVLDMSTPAWSVEFESDKHNVDIRFAFTPETFGVWKVADNHVVTVALPVAMSGTVQVPPMPAPLAVRGWIAITHVQHDVGEDELVLRRLELFAHPAGRGFYASVVFTPDGRQRRWLLAQPEQGTKQLEVESFAYSETLLAGTEQSDYPLPGTARIVADRAVASSVEITTQREILRWNPLDLVPQPFRWLMSLRARPQRVWANAHLVRTADPTPRPRTPASASDAILAVTFVQPQTPAE